MEARRGFELRSGKGVLYVAALGLLVFAVGGVVQAVIPQGATPAASARPSADSGTCTFNIASTQAQDPQEPGKPIKYKVTGDTTSCKSTVNGFTGGSFSGTGTLSSTECAKIVGKYTATFKSSFGNSAISGDYNVVRTGDGGVLVGAGTGKVTSGPGTGIFGSGDATSVTGIGTACITAGPVGSTSNGNGSATASDGS
ncbi:hypothetical protein GCM10022267_83400 [Lentzea roselyniae]|uniref:Uncharacterized protein n=1 Tax=Lentzea roselyniae TaxID=531940 RepID=A0ABP7CD22_9PSEU